MSIYEIPLTPDPQSFTITLGGIEYRLTVQYRNTDQGGWVLDIADNAGNPIIQGTPMVTGCNLLAQYRHLGFTGGLYVQTTDNPDAVPTFDNLGTDAHLYWVTA